MWPSRGHAAETIHQLEDDIVKVRAQQLAASHELEAAMITELRWRAMADASSVIQSRCQRVVAECADAISSLQDEIAAIVPEQEP